MHDHHRDRVRLATFSLVLALASLPLVWLGFPCPRGDDAVYKSPGAEWAAHGRLIIPALTGLLETADQGFAHYPPLYPLAYGAWYRAVGFSLRSTLAFSHLIHLIQTTLAVVVCWRLLVQQATVTGRVRCGLVLATGLLGFSNWAYFDRPEELGLVWIWSGLLGHGFLEHGERWDARIAWGAFVGLAALTAPFVGLLGALLLLVGEIQWLCGTSNEGFRVRCLTAGIRLLISGGIAATLVCCWLLSVELRHPGMLRDQLFRGNLAFSAGGNPAPYLDRLHAFPSTLFFNASQLPGLAIVMLLPLAWFQGESRSRPAERLWLTAVIGLVVTAVLRPSAYTYVGAAFMLATPCFGLAASRFVANSGILGKVGAAVVLLCVLYACHDLGRFFGEMGHWNSGESPDVALAELQRLVPAGDTVAVTPRHWHVFQGRNPWRDAYLSSLRDDREVRRCDWLVLYPGAGAPPYLDAFELRSQVDTRASRDHTYAYALWQRRAVDDVQHTPPITSRSATMERP